MNHMKRRAVILATAAVFAATGAVISAEPASATPAGCSWGWIDGHKVWAYCNGSGQFSVTAQCYYWGANTAYGTAPRTLYATCPNWSHVTNVIVARY
jgi:hypothetical protein